MSSTASPQTPHRVLLVGLGRVGFGYDVGTVPEAQVFTHARAFAHHGAFALVGAVDPEASARAAFGALYGLPAFEDLSEALGRLKPSGVVVATPTPTHLSVVRSVLALARPHWLVCEKPLAQTPAESREIVQLCASKACELVVNYLRRSDPTVAALRERLADGRLPSPLKGLVWYSKGLYNSASHFVNLLQDLWGEGPVLRSVVRRSVRSDGDPEPDFTLDFPKGSVVFLSHRAEDFFHNTMEWLSPAGRLRYEGGGFQCTWEPCTPVQTLGGMARLAGLCEKLPVAFHREQAHFVEQFASFLAGRPAHLSRGEDALRTVDLLHQIQAFEAPKSFNPHPYES